MKKFLTLLLTVALTATLAITGTVAYLTDTDEDVNVMTLGNVYIDQIEQERDANGKLVPFTQAKPVYPAVYEGTSIPYATPGEYPVANNEAWKVVEDNKNVVDKFVTVKNTGKSNAYVRTLIAFEIGKDGYCDPYMHLVANFGVDSDWDFGWTDITLEEDDSQYAIGVFTHKTALVPGETTEPNIKQVYLDKTATNEVCAAYGDTFEIKVLSQAVQTEGFADATEALTAGFGEVNATNVAIWFDGIVAPTMVDSHDDMKAAIAAGEKNILAKGVKFTEGVNLGNDVNATFVDCEFTGNGAWKYANNVTYQNCTFDSGADNAAIHFDKLYGELVVNNCTFESGKVQIGTDGDSSAVFNNCVFGETTTTSIWSEKGMRFYCPTVFNNCEFNNRVVLAGSNGLSITFNKCTMNNGTPVYYVDNNDGIIRGGNIPTVVINN